MTGNWIAVASADHVARGRAAGFMQVCHGKAVPLRRIRPGDRVIYYSPTQVFGGGEVCQAFTAIGLVGEGAPYQVSMGADFHPFRRDVAWREARPASIRPLLPMLDFAGGRANWGYQLRFGLFAISPHDGDLIAAAMGIGQDASDAAFHFESEMKGVA